MTPSIRITLRQRQVLERATLGKTSQEIAEELAISKTTVDAHFRKLLAVTGLPNRLALVSWAVKNGVTDSI